MVVPVLVGQAGVGVAADGNGRQVGQAAQVVGHEFRAGGAVEADRQRLDVRDGGIERLDVLPPQHGAHGLDGYRDHYGHLTSGLLHGAAGTHDRGLEIQRVLCRFDEQQVDTALQQPQGLLAEGLDYFVERDAAGDGDRLGLRS